MKPLDSSLPYTDPIEWRRAAAVAMVTFVAPIVSLPFQVIHGAAGRWDIVVVHWLALVGALTARRWMFRGHLDRSAILAVASLLATVAYAAWRSGIAGPTAPFLCTPALVAALTLDRDRRVGALAVIVIVTVGTGMVSPMAAEASEFMARMSTFAVAATVGVVTVSMSGAVERLAAQVESARQRAVDASEAKDRLLAQVSHHFRTPLNVILGYTELLTEDAEIDGRDDSVRDLARIQQASHGLLRILDDILDVARVESGQLRFSYGTIDVGALVEQLTATVEPLAAARDNRFEVELDPIPFAVWLDEGRLRQVLLNLLGNACKFTERGVVRLRLGPDRADHLRFEVADTGRGMDEEQRRRLLEPRSQPLGGSSRRYAGSGLGLAICFRLVEAMGGELAVQSAPGVGTVVSGTLPVGARGGPP